MVIYIIFMYTHFLPPTPPNFRKKYVERNSTPREDLKVIYSPDWESNTPIIAFTIRHRVAATSNYILFIIIYIFLRFVRVVLT